MKYLTWGNERGDYHQWPIEVLAECGVVRFQIAEDDPTMIAVIGGDMEEREIRMTPKELSHLILQLSDLENAAIEGRR